MANKKTKFIEPCQSWTKFWNLWKAHEKFSEITRIYEVLKDDETRKRYDKYGEKGLDENFNPNQRYESWSFFHEEFGLYDNDENIEVLDRSRKGINACRMFINNWGPSSTRIKLKSCFWFWSKVYMKLYQALRPGSSSFTRSGARIVTSWRRNSESCRNNWLEWQNLVPYRAAITDKLVKCSVFVAIQHYWCSRKRQNTLGAVRLGEWFYFKSYK